MTCSWKKLLVILLSSTYSLAVPPAPRRHNDYAVHERRSSPPHQWERRALSIRERRTMMLPVRFNLAQRNIERARDILMEVSHPQSRQYGQHLTPQEVADLVSLCYPLRASTWHKLFHVCSLHPMRNQSMKSWSGSLVLVYLSAVPITTDSKAQSQLRCHCGRLKISVGPSFNVNNIDLTNSTLQWTLLMIVLNTYLLVHLMLPPCLILSQSRSSLIWTLSPRLLILTSMFPVEGLSTRGVHLAEIQRARPSMECN